MFCSKCGTFNPDYGKFCYKCGNNLQSSTLTSSNISQNNSQNLIHPQTPPKSPGLACVLSLCVVGLGQMYLGQVAKGLVMLIGAIIIGAITFGVAAIPVWIVAMIDAYNIGKKLENGKSVGQWEFF